MTIRNEKEYKTYEARVEKLMERGTELGDMELLSPEEKTEFTMLSEALDEYGRAYHPLPGRMSTLLTDAILNQVKERNLKQKDAARMIGISATTFSDLLHGRRPLSFDIARNLYKVLGVPADVVLA
ncbi:MAG: helix-turn-helix domain-containing protein [Bacteroidaceae bacterium]|nr:helix-turn-helix domain-containing protein [Bacteroidaceae bacterium]